ncbi:hypothetical protein HanIR_Chr11g0553431 [Helianthus annuus]|nr:hypothetical protein HanIR_Chr11g0553431 [Helianthus annuus]
MLCLLFISDRTLNTLLISSSGIGPKVVLEFDLRLTFCDATRPPAADFGVEGVELSCRRAYDFAISVPVMLMPFLTDE